MKVYIFFVPLVLASRLPRGEKESNRDGKEVTLNHFRSEQACQCKIKSGNISGTIILECIGLKVDDHTEIDLEFNLDPNRLGKVQLNNKHSSCPTIRELNRATVEGDWSTVEAAMKFCNFYPLHMLVEHGIGNKTMPQSTVDTFYRNGGVPKFNNRIYCPSQELVNELALGIHDSRLHFARSKGCEMNVTD